MNNYEEQYNKERFKKYLSCNHIWVTVPYDNSFSYRGCIKCGLDERVFALLEEYHDIGLFTQDEQLMYDFMNDYSYRTGITSNVKCDFELAKAIYLKIKESHPEIDDETAKKYFEISLDNIRHIRVSDKRKINRAKRLSLSPKFNKWM